MSSNDLEQKILNILLQLTKHTMELDPSSIDYPISIEELSDCTYLLDHGCDDTSIRTIIESTTNGELHDLCQELRCQKGA